MSEPGFISQVVRMTKDGPTGPNASLWLDTPVLGMAIGRGYQGRVVVEVWDKGEMMFRPAHPGNSSQTAYVLELAVSALRSINWPSVRTDTWPNQPVMGELPSHTFLGRVVIEIWDSQTAIDVTGSGERGYLVERAIQRLGESIKTLDTTAIVNLAPLSQ